MTEEDKSNRGNPKITGFLPKWFRDDPFDGEDEGSFMIGPGPDEMEDKEVMTAIKPCPFCGGKAIIDNEGDSSEEPDLWLVVCLECAAVVEDEYVNKAIAKWNRRDGVNNA